MGRFFFSDEVRKAKMRYGYDIVEGQNSSVRIKVGANEHTPQEIAAFVLRKMKAVAEFALKTPIDNAVITVPAYFNDNQRQATRDAGRIAGLEVLRIINEPTAAALAYGFGKAERQHVAVYDLGGGTFDISVLEIGKDVYEVLSTAGDTYLGGDDIDDRVVTFLTNAFYQQSGIDLRENRDVLPTLIEAAEDGKKHLATNEEVEFNLVDLVKDKDGKSVNLTCKLSRKELGRLCMDLIQRTFKVCDEALQSAKMLARDLDGVILVGGPTRLPFISGAVAHYFQTQPKAGVDPDEVVALGAALHAHQLTVGSTSGEAGTTLLDVTPLSLRIATVAGYTEAIIDKNTPIPIERSKRFTTVRDGQDRVQVVVLQGESRMQKNCQMLGEFEFAGLRKASRGEVMIDVTFEIDANGIVNVSAKDIETGRKASATIRLSGGLSEKDVQAAKKRTHGAALTPVR